MDGENWTSQCLLNRLPTAGINNVQSEHLFRFNRVVVPTESFVEQLDLKHQKANYQVDQRTNRYDDWPFSNKRRLRNQLLPPPGLPPPTAAELFQGRFQGAHPTSTVDRCIPPEYQELPQDAELHNPRSNGFPTPANSPEDTRDIDIKIQSDELHQGSPNLFKKQPLEGESVKPKKYSILGNKSQTSVFQQMFKPAENPPQSPFPRPSNPTPNKAGLLAGSK